MRQLLFLVAACGGGGQRAATSIDNTATAQAQKRCVVIPEGKYLFSAAPTEDLLMGLKPAGQCTTGFAGSAQEITCHQASPEVRLQGMLASREGIHLTSSTLAGELLYSDAVVLLGGLKGTGGSLFVRLELLDCETEEECHEAMRSVRPCQ